MSADPPRFTLATDKITRSGRSYRFQRDSHGQWVMWADCDKLLAVCNEAEAEVEKLMTKIIEAREERDAQTARANRAEAEKDAVRKQERERVREALPHLRAAMVGLRDGAKGEGGRDSSIRIQSKWALQAALDALEGSDG